LIFTAQNQYNARRAGITSAIVIAIAIPVGIAGFCLVLTLREKAAERAAAKGGYDQGTFQPRQEAARNNYDYVDTNTTEVKKSSSHSSLNVK